MLDLRAETPLDPIPATDVPFPASQSLAEFGMPTAVRHNPLLIILLGALALRIVAALLVQHRLDHVWDREFVIAGDAAGYWELGRKIAAHDEFSLYDPPRRVHRMPGFPLVLAISRKAFGPSFLAARMVLAVIGTLACWLVFLLGRELFDESVALIATGMTAVAPVLIGFSVLILSETLFALCLLGSLYFLARLVKASNESTEQPNAIGFTLLAGAMIAVACYVRPSWLLAAPFYAAALVILADNKKRGAIHGLVLTVATLAALTPWAYRNYHVCGHWVVTTLWAGPSLYDGLNPNATGDSNMEFFDDEQLSQTMSEYEVDQHYRQRAWKWAGENPGRALELAYIKGIRYWKPWPNAAQFDHIIYRLAVLIFFVPIIVLALRGWWVYRSDVWVWLLTLGPVLYFFAIHLLFVGSLRYRLPAEYPMCVLSAAGLQSWLTEKRHLETSTDR